VEVAASHFVSSVPPVVSSLRVSADEAAVAAAPDVPLAAALAQAAGVHLAEGLAASEQAHFGLFQADYLAAEPADDLTQVDLVPADLPQDDCSAAPQAVDLVPAGYWARVGLVVDDYLAAQRADDWAPVAPQADAHSAPAAPLDDCSETVDLVPAGLAPADCLAGAQAVDLVQADYSAEAGSVAADSAAQKADDHSAPAALDDCSRVVDLAPADLVPDGCLAGPLAAESARVDCLAVQPAGGLMAPEWLRPELAGRPGGSRADCPDDSARYSASPAFPEAPS
jgi:hypothetical protein